MNKNELNSYGNLIKFNPEVESPIKTLADIDFTNFPLPDIVPQSIRGMERRQNDFLKTLSTPEERMKPITDRVDKLQKELECQTSELQKLRYENIKLNSKIEILNKTNDKQLSEISDLKANETTSKNTIVALKQEVENVTRGGKWSVLKGFFIGVGGTVIGGLLLNYITTII